MKGSSFTIEFTKSAYRHLETFRRFDRNRILDSIKEQLTYALHTLIIEGEEVIL
jgi:hypothetical protein